MSIFSNRANLWLVTLSIIFSSGCPDGEQRRSASPSTRTHETSDKPFRILILGDSLTEGYGVSPAQSYPSLLEKLLNQDQEAVSTRYFVINGGITGATTSGGASRIDWYLKSPPDFLIVALGGNDGLRGIPPEESKKNLKSILLRALNKKVPVMLAGMKMPPNYGSQYLQRFENIFPQLAEELDIPLLPFLLEGVGGNPKMNLPDRIHPNPSGHQRICQTVHQHLIKYLP